MIGQVSTPMIPKSFLPGANTGVGSASGHRELPRRRMRLPKTLLRSLVILLVLRAVIAPVTVRTIKAGHLQRARVVMCMRVGWPLQRLERFSSSSKLLKLFQGKHKDQSDASGWWLTARAPWACPAIALSTHGPADVCRFCLDRSAVSPRC